MSDLFRGVGPVDGEGYFLVVMDEDFDIIFVKFVENLVISLYSYSVGTLVRVCEDMVVRL